MQPAQNSKLPDLGASLPNNTPHTEQQFAVSDPTLQPAAVNLPPVETQAPSQPIAPQVQIPLATAYAPAPTNQVFVNPNPPVVPLATEPQPIANQPIEAATSDINDQIPYADQPPRGPKIPKFVNPKLVIIGLVVLLLLSSLGFGVNEFYFNRISSLSLVSEESQYYLSLAVKKAPQAEATKTLVKKFPSGDKLLKQFDKYYTNYIADDKKDPLVDMTQYAEEELLFSRISRASGPDDYSRHLLAIIGAESSDKAKEALSNFEDDKATYQTTKVKINETEVYELSLQSEKEIYEEQLSRGSTRSSLQTPKPKKLYATSIENFLVASDQKDDIKKTIELSQSSSILGFKGSDQPKSVLDTPDHKKLEPHFPKENFLRFFQRDPITPYNAQTPFGRTYVDTNSQSPESEAKTFQKISRALTVEATDQGAVLQSLQLHIPDVKAPDSDYSVSNSLANKLPKQFSGVSPTWFGETRNLKDQYRYLNDLAEKMKDSKSRSQRESFEEYIKSRDEAKGSYKKAYGLDFEKDVLDWLTNQTAIVINAGSAKKGPEVIAFAEISDQKKVEESLKQITLPDSAAQVNDARRKSDLRSIASALELYQYDNDTYPSSLAALQTSSTGYGVYLRTIPKDPVSGQNYSYTTTSGGSNYSLSANLDDGQTITYTASGTASYKGTKKNLVLKPVAANHNGTNIYSLKLYSYEKISYGLYFAVTDKLVMLGFSDSDSSYKQVVDFQKNSGDKLSQNNEFKSQFDSVKDKVNGLSFIEPINVWGFVDYLEATYPEYKEAASSYSGTEGEYLDNLEKAIKGFLKTVPSIGTYGTSKNDVSETKTLFKIKELSSEEKKVAEEALDKLLAADEDNDYESVLGIDSQSFSDKVKASVGTFYREKVRAFVSPSLLPN